MIRISNEPAKSQRIRRGLIVVLILLQAVTVFIVLGLSRITAESVLVEQAKSILLNAANESLQHTRGFITPAYRATTTVADMLTRSVLEVGDERKLELYFLSLLQNNAELAGIFVATADGDFSYVSRNTEVEHARYRTKLIRHQNNKRGVVLRWRDGALESISASQDPNDRYNPLTRPWYLQAYSSNRVIWTDPYTFYTSKKPGITVAAPYYNQEGTIAGIVGVDIELTALSEFLSQLNLGEGGSAFIVNQEEVLVALSTPEYLNKHNTELSLTSMRKVSDINYDVVTLAFNKFSEQLPDSRQQEIKTVLKVNETTYIAVFVPFDLPQSRQWVISVQVPKSSFLKSIQENQNRNLVLGLCVLLLSLLIGWILVTRTSRPVVELQNQAIHDHLTNLFNRRHLSEVVVRIFENLKAEQKPFSIAMIDIDRFKKINDSYGHGVGDEILIVFSRRLKSGLRESDVVARYGGEEFIVLLPETELEAARSMLERIRRSVESSAFRTSIGLINITTSIGIASMKTDDAIWRSVLERADQRLYEAKVGGRNQVVA